MRVLLVIPPSYGLSRDSQPTFHLGVGYLAATLRKEGHEVCVYDANCPRDPERKRLHSEGDAYTNIAKALSDHSQPIWNEVGEVLREQKPEIVGISVKALDLRLGLEISRIAKRVIPTCRVVFGGPAATTCPELLLADDSTDYVVRGEGEVTMAALVRALEGDPNSVRDIDGLSYSGSNGIVHNPNRPLIEDLDSLPLPARDLLLYLDRQPPSVRRAMMGDMVTSRGCPFGCTYCANKTVWGTRRVRERSPDSIVQEMMHLRDTYGSDRLILWDDQLTMNRPRVVELCVRLIGRGAPVRWLTYAHPNTLDTELVHLLKAAGCYELQMGVESGSDRILKTIKKGSTVARVREAAKVLSTTQMRWHGFFMIGFPSETAAEMRETLRFLYELKPSTALLSVVTPYPGTELFDEAVRNGCLRNDEWLLADTNRLESVLVDTMTSQEFSRIAYALAQKFNEFNDSRAFLDAPPAKRVAYRMLQRVYRAARKAPGVDLAVRVKRILER